MYFEIWTLDEAAERARISRRQLNYRIRAGRGSAVTRIGGSVRVRSDALEAWIEQCTAQPAVGGVARSEGDHPADLSPAVDEVAR